MDAFIACTDWPSCPLRFRAEEARQSFRIDRELSPHSIRVPLIQAQAALPYDQDEVVMGWQEAMRRAAKIDQLGGASTNRQELVKASIQNVVIKKPGVAKLAERALPPSEFQR